MSPATELLIQGVILVEQEVADFSGAEARVYLEDVSRADASARIVGRATISNVCHQAGQDSSIAFQICGEPVDLRASYSARVHISLPAQPEVQVGDYVSVQSYPVLTYNHPARVTLKVKEVR